MMFDLHDSVKKEDLEGKIVFGIWTERLRPFASMGTSAIRRAPCTVCPCVRWKTGSIFKEVPQNSCNGW